MTRIMLATVLVAGSVFAQPKGADAGAPPSTAETKPEETKPTGAKPGEEAAAEPPKEEAPKEEGSKPGAADTRSEGMKAYLQALEKRRLAATAPLSRQRLRELDASLKPGGKYEMATRTFVEGDKVDTALAQRLVAAAIELNQDLGDPRG